jgi:hypothetical protein
MLGWLRLALGLSRVGCWACETEGGRVSGGVGDC